MWSASAVQAMHKKTCKTISVGLKKFTSYLDRISVEQELEKLFLEFLNHLRLPNPKLKWRFRAGDICTTCEKMPPLPETVTPAE